MREYGISAPGLETPEPVTSRRSAERLAAVVPGGRVVVRFGNVENGFLGVGYRAGGWLAVGERETQTGGTDGGTDGEAERSRGASGRKNRRAPGRAACSVVFAPDAYPYVFAHDWIARSPALVLRSESVRVELDLSGLCADDALAFIAELRITLDVYASQWEEWESRAEFDYTRPYTIPPPIYGDPEAPGGASDHGPDSGVRDCGDVPGGCEGGA